MGKRERARARVCKRDRTSLGWERLPLLLQDQAADGVVRIHRHAADRASCLVLDALEAKRMPARAL